MKYFSYENIMRNISFLLYIAAIAMIYIWNTHYAEKNRREINTINKELKELRWKYVVSKSSLMHRSKQSEVAKLVEPLGLTELTSPPHKLVISY